MKRAQRRAGPVKREPEVTALLTDAGAHLDAGRSDEAEELCKDITARAPLDAEAFHMLAIIAYKISRNYLTLSRINLRVFHRYFYRKLFQ